MQALFSYFKTLDFFLEHCWYLLQILCLHPGNGFDILNRPINFRNLRGSNDTVLETFSKCKKIPKNPGTGLILPGKQTIPDAQTVFRMVWTRLHISVIAFTFHRFYYS